MWIIGTFMTTFTQSPLSWWTNVFFAPPLIEVPSLAPPTPATSKAPPPLDDNLTWSYLYTHKHLNTQGQCWKHEYTMRQPNSDMMQMFWQLSWPSLVSVTCSVPHMHMFLSGRTYKWWRVCCWRGHGRTGNGYLPCTHHAGNTWNTIVTPSFTIETDSFRIQVKYFNTN